MSNHQKTILVVEDNPIAAMMTKNFLMVLGCQVDCVTDGDAAVKQVLKHKYNGICMDIGLPTLSGIDACVAIRKYETEHQLPPIPIIAVTANNSPQETEEYIKAGMQAAIDKPFTKEKAEHFLTYCT